MPSPPQLLLLVEVAATGVVLCCLRAWAMGALSGIWAPSVVLLHMPIGV